MDKVRIGIIGGSGIYEMTQLVGAHEVALDTPFGAPSDTYVVGRIDGDPVVFLPRHGRGHRVSPGRLNSRANIYGFKMLGVEYLISISACGSLQLEHRPGDIVIPNQVFDLARSRPSSFFDDPSVGTAGLVVHVSVAEPFCPFLSSVCAEAIQATGHPVYRGGTLVTVERPRFSTKAESAAFRQLGFALVGMTAAPEVFLAREAEMSYATMAHVTDYDVWHETEAPVTADTVVQQLLANAEIAKASVVNAVHLLRNAPPTPYANALRDALITNPTAIPAAVKERLDLLVGHHLQRA